MQESVDHSLPPFRTLIRLIIVGIKIIHLAGEASETYLPMQVPLRENCDIFELHMLCNTISANREWPAALSYASRDPTAQDIYSGDEGSRPECPP
jgi:hypothetical protein